MNRSRTMHVLFALALLPALLPVRAQISYSIQRVDPTDKNAVVTDINNLGEVVGTSGFQSPPTKAILWRNGQRVVLGSVLADGLSSATAINDRSEITGYSSNLTPDLQTGRTRAWIWRQGALCGLGPLFNKPNILGRSINNRSQILGSVSDQSVSTFQAFIWQAGRATLLPVLAGRELNDRGEFLTNTEDLPDTTGLYQGGVVTGLIGLTGATSTVGNALSNQGQVAGASFMPDNEYRALWWHTAQSTPQELPKHPKAIGSYAQAINDNEQIVGFYICRFTRELFAVRWQNGTVYRLTDAIRANDPLKPYVKLRAGTHINNRGQIIAIGVDSRDPLFVNTAFLLTPVP